MQTMVRQTLIVLALAIVPLLARADGPGRIYTKTSVGDQGALTGKTGGPKLTHAIAVERDRKRVFLAELTADKTGFRFANLPVGRYDLVLVGADGRLWEGLSLGGPPPAAGAPAANMARRVAEADSFFNRHLTHRAGMADGVVLVFVERIRDREILRGSGERVNAWLRRLEIMEMQEASDDWQTTGSRHLFREEIPLAPSPAFLRHQFVPALGGVRIVDAARDLGTIALDKGTRE